MLIAAAWVLVAERETRDATGLRIQRHRHTSSSLRGGQRHRDHGPLLVQLAYEVPPALTEEGDSAFDRAAALPMAGGGQLLAARYPHPAPREPHRRLPGAPRPRSPHFIANRSAVPIAGSTRSVSAGRSTRQRSGCRGCRGQGSCRRRIPRPATPRDLL